MNGKTVMAKNSRIILLRSEDASLKETLFIRDSPLLPILLGREARLLLEQLREMNADPCNRLDRKLDRFCA